MGYVTKQLKDATGANFTAVVWEAGRDDAAESMPVALSTEDLATLQSIAGLSIPPHDYVGLTYTGDNLTGVVYKTGGSGGTTVGTLTLVYSGAVLTSVTRS